MFPYNIDQANSLISMIKEKDDALNAALQRLETIEWLSKLSAKPESYVKNPIFESGPTIMRIKTALSLTDITIINDNQNKTCEISKEYEWGMTDKPNYPTEETFKKRHEHALEAAKTLAFTLLPQPEKGNE